MFIIRIFLIASLFVSISTSVVWSEQVLNDAFVARPFDHRIWQEVLGDTVDGFGNVDFDRLKAYPKRLNDYMAQLAVASPDTHPTYFPSRNHRLAYWLNARNALMMRHVLDAYPVENLTDIPGLMENPKYFVGGRPTSVVMIDERVRAMAAWNLETYFALSNLTKGSPPLLNHAYVPPNLDAQIEANFYQFLKRPYIVQLDTNYACRPVSLDASFSGFLEGFSGSRQSFLMQLKPYLSPETQGELARPGCDRQVELKPESQKLRYL